MAIYRVLHYPHVLLKKKSSPITEFTPQLREFVQNLVETAKEFDGGGIAAPQVGVNKRIFICDFSQIFAPENTYFEKKEGDFVICDSEGKEIPPRFPLICINPEIIKKEHPIITDWEGCLSMPDTQSHRIERFHSIEMKAFDEFGKEFFVKTTHLYAAVNFQHEIDHLDGLLMIDRWNKNAYTVKTVLAEIKAFQNDTQYRKKLKKLNLQDATQLKFS